MAEINVGKTTKFPMNQITEVRVSGLHCLVARTPAGWFAFDPSCPHAKRPLNDAILNERTVQCLWHMVEFDMGTGEVRDDSGYFSIPNLTVYEVRIADQNVLVCIP